MDNRGKVSGVLCLYFLVVWLSFSVFFYPVLNMSQEEIINTTIDVDVSLIQGYIGWETGKQSTLATLIICCVMGIFFLTSAYEELQVQLCPFHISADVFRVRILL